MSNILIQFCYLLAAVLFILGLRGLTSAKTAARGNALAALKALVDEEQAARAGKDTEVRRLAEAQERMTGAQKELQSPHT